MIALIARIRRNAQANGQDVCNVMKEAWGEDNGEPVGKARTGILNFYPLFNSLR